MNHNKGDYMRKLLAVAMIGTSLTAQASVPEYFYRPGAGSNEVRGTFSLRTFETESGLTQKKTKKTEANDLRLQYSYGLSEELAFGTRWSVLGETKESVTGSPSTKQMGVDDPTLFVRGSSDMIFYGADLGLGLSKRKAATPTESGTRVSGGLSLGGEVGIAAGEETLNYGGKLALAYPFERKIEGTAGAADTTVNGGMITALAAFIESRMGATTLGGEVSYNLVSDTTTKPPTGPEEKTKSFAHPTLMAYGNYDFWSELTALIRLEMALKPTQETETNGVKTAELAAANEGRASVGVRYTF
jgi:hypothetical protein